MSRDEWIQRYAARVKDRAEMDDEFAIECAKAGAEAYEEAERGAGNAVCWDDENPEDAADEEMTYWTDDEGAA